MPRRRAVLLAILGVAAAVTTDFSAAFTDDDECKAAASSDAAGNSATGSDVVAAMRSGFWGCAEALAYSAAASGNMLAVDINNMVHLESRAINMKISALRSALDSARPPSQIIHPAFQWAQSGDSIFLNVKFAHKIDAPATLDVNVDSVELTNVSVSLRASKERKAFELDLTPLRFAIDPDASTWTLGSVGRAMFTLKKAAEKPKKWPALLAKNAKKPAQMGLWWDRQEEFTKELDKLDDDDDDDDDGDSAKQKKKDEKRKAKKEKKAKKKKEKPPETEEQAKLREARVSIEKEIKAKILELEAEAKKLKDEIDLDTKTKKAAIDADTEEKRKKLEEEAKQKKAGIIAAAEDKEAEEWAKTAFDKDKEEDAGAIRGVSRLPDPKGNEGGGEL